MSGELAQGTMVDARHRIDGVLGSGGFATVYLGTDVAAERRVAIKVLSDNAHDGGRSQDRFEREIRAVSSLRDPHTVRLFTHGRLADGRPFIVFEHVEGEDLRELMERSGPLDVAFAEDVVRQVLQSLREAHQHGVLHRDIKPANIRIFPGPDGRVFVKVLDFGIARLADTQDARLTRTGELIGTPRYMSPEQLLSEALTQSSDIYSLGVVAVEMLLGTSGIHGNSLPDQIDRLRTGHLFATSGEHGRFHRVLAKMTARDPAARYASAEAVLSALEHKAPPPPSAEIRPQPTPQPPGERTPDPFAEPARDPGLAVDWRLAIGVVLILAVMFAILTLLSRDKRPSDPPPTSRANPLTHAAPPHRPLAETRVPAKPLESEPDAPPETRGCGWVPDWRGSEEFVLRVSHGVLTAPSSERYAIHLPRKYDPSRPHALLLLFHSLAHNGQWFLRDVGLETLADAQGIIVVTFGTGTDEPFNRSDLDLVLAATEHAKNDLCVDPGRVYAIAHGQGTAFARVLPCHTDVTAIAVTGDWAQRTDPTCAKVVPYLRVAGLRDPYVPTDGGLNCVGAFFPSLSLTALDDVIEERQDLHGCEGAARPFGRKDRHGQCETWSCETPFVSCTHDGGHSFADADLLTMDPCANPVTRFPVLETMWSFLEAQRAADQK